MAGMSLMSNELPTNPPTKLSRGKFIALEGAEGVGKSTNIALVQSQLEAAKLEVVVTREPGGTVVGEGLRALLLDPSQAGIDPMTELLLMFAARKQHVTELIEPALSQGKWVVSDRFVDSSYAYQGGGRGLPIKLIEEVERFCMAGFAPDLTILLDLDPAIGLKRAAQLHAPDRFEQENLKFFNAVRQTFLERAQGSAKHAVVDASQPLEAVQNEVSSLVDKLLAGG